MKRADGCPRDDFGDAPPPCSVGPRGLGVGRLLMRAIERQALGRGSTILYAATTRIVRLAVRHG